MIQNSALQTDGYKDKAIIVLNKFSNIDCRRIDLGPFITEDIDQLDLSRVLTIKRTESFSPFLPKHQKAADYLITLFLGIITIGMKYYQ